MSGLREVRMLLLQLREAAKCSCRGRVGGCKGPEVPGGGGGTMSLGSEGWKQRSAGERGGDMGWRCMWMMGDLVGYGEDSDIYPE